MELATCRKEIQQDKTKKNREKNEKHCKRMNHKRKEVKLIARNNKLSKKTETEKNDKQREKMKITGKKNLMIMKNKRKRRKTKYWKRQKQLKTA